MKKLIILRGLPGAGKSTARATIAFNNDCADTDRIAFVSTDDYFRRPDGKYAWYAGELSTAHAWAQDLARHFMESKTHVIIIDNTNIKRAHMQPYIDLAAQHGYEVEEHVIGGPYPVDEETLRTYFERQKHGVPWAAMVRMNEGWEP